MRDRLDARTKVLAASSEAIIGERPDSSCSTRHCGSVRLATFMDGLSISMTDS